MRTAANRSKWVVKDEVWGVPWYLNGYVREGSLIVVKGTGDRSHAMRFGTRSEAQKACDCIMFGKLFGGERKVSSLFPIGIMKVEEVC